MKTFQASICLGLLLCVSACDEGSEGPDELALEREAELETMLEIMHGVELERVDRLSDSDAANDELALTRTTRQSTGPRPTTSLRRPPKAPAGLATGSSRASLRAAIPASISIGP
ncbi:MAG: hypothetical protein HC927_10155 [Deltaproteobacteria bacterium]|nr:hypothetical protein [Deltaproteobacteria bacterium]